MESQNESPKVLKVRVLQKDEYLAPHYINPVLDYLPATAYTMLFREVESGRIFLQGGLMPALQPELASIQVYDEFEFRVPSNPQVHMLLDLKIDWKAVLAARESNKTK